MALSQDSQLPRLHEVFLQHLYEVAVFVDDFVFERLHVGQRLVEVKNFLRQQRVRANREDRKGKRGRRARATRLCAKKDEEGERKGKKEKEK